MQEAAESRDTGEFMSYIRKDYQDEQGRDWKGIRAVVHYQFIRNKALHVYQYILGLTVSSDEQHASAVILVAMAGQPIDGVESLESLRADIMRFEVEFVFDEKWQVSSAVWKPATAKDFLL